MIDVLSNYVPPTPEQEQIEAFVAMLERLQENEQESEARCRCCLASRHFVQPKMAIYLAAHWLIGTYLLKVPYCLN
jgi:hypothetical protein